MPYTLMMFLLWGVAFFAIGVLVGWMLRALRARGASAGGSPASGSPSEEPPSEELPSEGLPTGDDRSAPTE